MRLIDHVIAGGTGGAVPARKSPVFDPNTGAVQAEVALGDAAMLDRAVAAAEAAQPAWAAQLAHHAQPAPEGLPRLDNRVFAATVADLLGYGGATAYPSLGAPQDAPEPLLGGQPYRARAQANACDVRAQGGPLH